MLHSKNNVTLCNQKWLHFYDKKICHEWADDTYELGENCIAILSYSITQNSISFLGKIIMKEVNFKFGKIFI